MSALDVESDRPTVTACGRLASLLVAAICRDTALEAAT
jgi:hypothetical protein